MRISGVYDYTTGIWDHDVGNSCSIHLKLASANGRREVQELQGLTA